MLALSPHLLPQEERVEGGRQLRITQDASYSDQSDSALIKCDIYQNESKHI